MLPPLLPLGIVMIMKKRLISRQRRKHGFSLKYMFFNADRLARGIRNIRFMLNFLPGKNKHKL